MKLRSRGLGRRELVMDFREYDIVRDGDDVVVSGTIREPVTWDFTIRISGDDIPGMLRVGLHRQTLSLAARWILHIGSKLLPIPAAAPVPLATAARPRPSAPRPVQGRAESELGDPADLGSEALGMTAASITHLRRPATPPVSPPVEDPSPVAAISRTPAFGVPRRRGWSPPEEPPFGAVAEGGGR
jgi:hypothetical protein